MVRESRLTAVALTATFLLLALQAAAARIVQAQPAATNRVATTVEKADPQPALHATWQMGIDLKMPSLVGAWHADSISMALPDGSRKTLGGAGQSVTLTVSGKTCRLRVGTTVLATMAYLFDPKQDPWTIDMKSQEDPMGAMLGICAWKGDRLQISLDDQAKGRPGDFDKEKHGMVLVLRRSFPGPLLLVMNADGGSPRPIDPRQILAMPELTFVGTPHWSHDGRKIAFDGWRAALGEDCSNAHVFVANADGSGAKDLGAGAMPSWSPDDKQFTFCRYGAEYGVWIMNTDGSQPRQVAAGAWGSQWSPKGSEIAYTTYDNRGAALCIYDVAKKQRRELEHKSYQQIYWGITWSPDGTWICFKGVLPGGGEEIAALSVEGAKKGFKVLLPSSALPEVGNADNTMSWGGGGGQILVRMQRKSDRQPQLYLLDPMGIKPPQLFPNFPAGWLIGHNPAWSWDGKKVIMAGYLAKPKTK